MLQQQNNQSNDHVLVNIMYQFIFTLAIVYHGQMVLAVISLVVMLSTTNTDLPFDKQR